MNTQNMRKSSKSLNQNDDEMEQENAHALFVSQSLKQSTTLRVFILFILYIYHIYFNSYQQPSAY